MSGDKVFVLRGDMGYDGSYVLGVYSSHDKAVEAEAMFEQTKLRLFRAYFITEVIIDGAPDPIW
jgi:hypothetical protein